MVRKEACRTILVATILITPLFFQNIHFRASLESHNRREVSNPRLFSTYFGGDSQDFCTEIVTDSTDNILVAGYTNSVNFPTLNASDPTFNGWKDAFCVPGVFVGDVGARWDFYICHDCAPVSDGV